MARNIQREFEKYYKERLASLGFIKVKGRQPYFVRVINDEILHIIAPYGENSSEQGYKAFTLRCAVATVYRQEINFETTPRHNGDWFVTYGKLMELKDSVYPAFDGARDLKIYYYNEDNMDETLKSVEEGIMNIVGELDKIIDMDSVMRWLLKYDSRNIIQSEWAIDDSYVAEESLYYMRKNYGYYKFEKAFEEIIGDLVKGHMDEERKVKKIQDVKNWNKRMFEGREKVITNETNYTRAISLLKEHYYHNVRYLNSVGVLVEEKDISILFL